MIETQAGRRGELTSKDAATVVVKRLKTCDLPGAP